MNVDSGNSGTPLKARRDLLVSIASTIEDYRAGDLPRPTAGHVDRWVRQFAAAVQIPMLRELDHVLRYTYFSEAQVRQFLDGVIGSEKLAGREPRQFWRQARLLDIQRDGNSQSEIRLSFVRAIEQKYGTSTGAAAANGVFVYLDDILFSGGRVGNDLSQWISEDSPPAATVHVVVIASHRFGEWKCGDRLRQRARSAGKNIRFRFWAARRVENRLKRRDDSEVLWPTELPAERGLTEYVEREQQFPFQPRRVGGRLQWSVFSSEEGRQLLEREFLLAGVRIRSFSRNPSAVMRPLGFSPFGVGFGSMIVTFRNCPNNAPLALWWGDPDAEPHHPFSRWYPLMQRRTYARAA